jgi:tetratricopeptide (TPR) repeat protein
MDTPFLSRFTPSLMTPDALESLFVQREEFLRNIVEKVLADPQGVRQKSLLLVGPRGIGKTHLVSLIYYRLQARDSQKARICIAWLREEEWGIACFRDFLFKILRALLPDGDTEFEPRLAALYALDAKDAEAAAVELIAAIAGSRRLVILTENFDDLVQRLGNMGGMQLFRFLQSGVHCILIATAPGPIDRVLPQGSPFGQGFFEIRRLQELSYHDALQLISKIARYQGDKELSAVIATPRGRARVRALRYLAGGNHRAYVIFAPLLAQESLDKLIQPLMQTIDDLTPYYNSRIASLSLEQRKIIEYVCEERHPVQSGEVARACFIAPLIASAQLESLCRIGHLQSFKIGDATYYELHEPLMRLSFEVKKHRGKPIGLLLDFLRLWYSPAELKQKLAGIPPMNALEHPYLPTPQIFEQNWEDPRVAECAREYQVAIQKRDYERALQAAADLAAVRGLRQDAILHAACLIQCGRNDQALSAYDRMLEENREDAAVWQLRACLLNTMGRYEDALESCNQSLRINPQAGRAWCDKASILLNLARPEEALDSCSMALELNDAYVPAWMTRGLIFADLNLFNEAFAAFSKAVALEPANTAARVHLCAALVELNRIEEALTEAQRAIETNPTSAESWAMMGLTLSLQDHRNESLYAFNKALALGADSSLVRYKVVELLFRQGRWREAADSLDKALAQFAHSENPNAGNTGALIGSFLKRLASPSSLFPQIRLLVLIYRKHGALGALGRGLIESIPEMISADAADDVDAVQWLECWQQLTGDFVEFRLPLRLLRTAVRYCKTRDLRIFMDLPQEERALIEPLLGIHVEAIA